MRRAILELLPKRILSRLIGELADIEIPAGLRRSFFGTFARRYGVELDELDRPLEDFESFSSFFGRPLRAGARPAEGDAETLISPVDGRLVAAEAIDEGRMLVVKGNPHRASELAAGLPDPQRYEQGQQLTLYLAPGDYHRIHAPIDARLRHWSHVPGALFPVNDLAFGCIPRLFARNERVAIELESERFGRMAVILVGALNVGSILVPALPELRSNQPGAQPSFGSFAPGLTCERGGELAAFGFGSTVVLLLERPCALDTARIDTHVRCGTALGRLSG
jgi:phosphatidylserine decarboxylase